MGATYVVSHDDGSTPVSIDCWNIAVTIGARRGASSFMKRQGIRSGPAALVGLMPASSFSTPLVLICRPRIGG